MNARFYRHMDLIFGFVGLFGGSGALIAALGEYKALGVATGTLIAAVAVIERLVRPVEKAVLHDEFKQHYAELNARAPTLSLEKVEKELIALQARAPSGIAALAIPAYNANLLTHGRADYLGKESKWSKFVAFFA